MILKCSYRGFEPLCVTASTCRKSDEVFGDDRRNVIVNFRIKFFFVSTV